ncbi:carboxylesterase [Bisporella sp. PMI_857]|nr:carboxylesterase [Bisporella sp. PMI_857]
MEISWSFLWIFSLLLFSSSAQELIASLDYGTFQGAYSETYNITHYRKIPYAAPPVGENRFRAPQPPLRLPADTIYNSDQSFDFCPQRTVNGTEDCLYLGLYSRPWTHNQPLRPVVVIFYGGGFVQGSASFKIPPSGYPILNVSSSNDFVVIYPNYRVNAFGFLPGSQIAKSATSDLNNGLLDQQAALKWTQKYIHKFGGDPRNVTIQGQSAGGGSVISQVIAHGGKTNPPLFSKALASSPFWPKTYKYDAPEAQDIYDTFARLAGCSGPESLKCLKKADLQTLRNASLQIAGSHVYNTSSYTWGPVIDGKFLTQSLSEATSKGQVNIDTGLVNYNTHEGENFIPPGLANIANTGSPAFNSSLASLRQWATGFLPKFSEQNIDQVLDLYPGNVTYTRAGLMYRDAVLTCPAYWTARAAHRRGYISEYTISPAKHASDVDWWNQVNTIQKSQPTVYEGYAGAMASFFQTGDPNAHKVTDQSQPGVPEIRRDGERFVITSDGFETKDLADLNIKCGFWREVADKVPI